MPDTPAYPYATHLDILHGPLEVIDVQALADACTDRWYNQTLCKVNDSILRLGVMQGEYHWHKHDTEDELFFVLHGRFLVDVDDSERGAVSPSVAAPAATTRAAGSAGSADAGTSGAAPAHHRTIELRPRQGFVVPKGIVHRTRAPERCIILMVENATVVPTGD